MQAKSKMKNWEIIADNLKKRGWSWGCVSAIDVHGRTIWIVDAHRGDGERFLVYIDEEVDRVFGTRIRDARLRRIVLTG